MDLDRHIPRQSPVHHFDARLKLILTVAAIVAITLLPVGAFIPLALAWFATILVSSLARLGPSRAVRGSWIALPFVLLALPLVFTRPGEPLFSIDLGPIELTATQAGLTMALTIVAKSWLSVQVTLLLAYTTPFPRLIDALRSLRLPAIMVSIISFMYRYLAVIGEEAGRMNRARTSRSAAAQAGSGGTIAWRARTTGSMVGSLFIRSFERSERVYAAMQARGFEGDLKGEPLPRPRTREIVASAILFTAFALFTLAVNVWWAS